MTWEDYKQQANFEHRTHAVLTNIECPKCGKAIYERTDIVLTTYPPQKSFFCKCGWHGTA